MSGPGVCALSDVRAIPGLGMDMVGDRVLNNSPVTKSHRSSLSRECATEIAVSKKTGRRNAYIQK